VRVSSDGTTIAGATGDGTVVLWQPEAGSIDTIDVFTGVIKDIAFAADGRSLVAVASVPDPITLRTVHLGDLSVRDSPIDTALRRVGFLADGSLVALNYGTNGPFLVSPTLSRLDHRLGWSKQALWDLAIDSRKRQVVALGEDQRVHVGELEAGGLVERWSAAVTEGGRVAVHRSGRVAVTGPGGVQLIERGGAAGPRLSAPVLQLKDVAFSPSGDLVAAGDLSGAIWVWDAGGRLLGELKSHTSHVTGVEFRGEHEIVSAAWDGTIRRWGVGPLRADLPTLRASIADWQLTLDEVLDRER
jgi:WD40 repeat protein